MWKNISLILIICLFVAGCGWLGILDTNPYDDMPTGYEEYHEQKVEEMRQALLGLSKEEVLAKLGKPERINDLGDSYQAPVKFRESQYVFDGTMRCRMAECGGPIFENESWVYGWKESIGRYRIYDGFGVFFNNDVVVAVE